MPWPMIENNVKEEFGHADCMHLFISSITLQPWTKVRSQLHKPHNIC